MTARLDIEHVRALLTPDTVISACAVDARQRGRAYRIRTCPACGARPSRQGAAIYTRRSDGTWRWTHHGHACGGDLLDLVAACDGIDRRTEFPKLLARCAQIAGIEAADPELEQRVAERRRQLDADRAREAAERAVALAAMPAAWGRLDRRSLVGERYLASRGLDAAELRAQDVVRFSRDGEIAVPLRSLDDGAIVGIQYRTPGGKGLRMEPYSDPTCAALFGRPTNLDPMGVDVAIVVEGLTDTLAAVLAFPGCAIYGAAGCSNLEEVARGVVPRVVDCRGWLLVVADNDEPGVRCASEAAIVALDAGLVLDCDLHLVDLGAYHDLADAWAAGWRWTWPETRRAP